MADTTTQADNVVKQWESKFFQEYVRKNQFAEFLGTGMNNVVQVKERLTSMPGDKISIPLVKALQGAGVSGNSSLEGNEESLINYAHTITVDTLRNGVRTHGLEQQRSAFDLLQAGRDMLMAWAMDRLRDDIIAAALSPVVDGTTTYAAATETQKDAWLTANADRVLFGSAKSNNAANDHSAALALIDNTADKLDAGIVSLIKRMAKSTTSGAIRPFRVDGSQEWFVLFCNSLAFRDLKNDTTILQANREAGVRGKQNPIFKDSDLLYDGVICREVPEIAPLAGVGAAGIDVAPNFLMGAQAIGIGYAQRTRARFQKDDYDYRQGVAVEEMRGVSKMMYNNVQHGQATVYTAGVADS